ncbi:MAG: membrane-bound lytic murein transglycosylase MltF [Desulfobacteraceae bacterium]|nr:membrane-bound lytic murein transglycosylase MltF [Desulfobacteraceae bacterium]
MRIFYFDSVRLHKKKLLKIKHALFFLLIIPGLTIPGLTTPGCYRPNDALQKIKNNGEIVIITDNSAHGFYLYQERPMGFEYQLVKKFADFLNVKLTVITPGWEKMFDTLLSNKGDLIASSLTKTTRRKTRLTFSDEYMKVQQQVIVRKGDSRLKKLSDLDGKTVHIRKNTSYHERLVELKKSGIDIHLAFYENTPTEELLRQVQKNEIKITIADSNIFRLNRRYYPDLKIAFSIAEQQSLGWAVKKSDVRLLKEINRFFDIIKKDGTFDRIYNKYYAGTEMFDYVDIKKFHNRLKTRLPAFKQIIENESKKYNFDWRLIAAVIYQESQFNPNAISYTGVRGLMQLTMPTADEMGVSNRFNPEESIKGGIKYLHKLYNQFGDLDPDEKLKFALGSYNVGYGHIKDARNIALKKGLDINKWSSLEQTLPLLRYREYHEKSIFGYARGTEPVRYVNRILTYYSILKMKPEASSGTALDSKRIL